MNLLVFYIERIVIEVTHYHLKQWIDHFPLYTDDQFALLDEFIRAFYLIRLNNRKYPSVVHCKGGIGRTCTFISMFYVYKRIRGGLRNFIIERNF